MKRNKTVIAFPWQMHWTVSNLSLLPPSRKRPASP